MDNIKHQLIYAARDVIERHDARDSQERLYKAVEGLRIAIKEHEESQNDPRNKAIRDLAEDVAGEGVEIDIDGVVSERADNGAYVQAWVWVDFADTKFNKECSECGEIPDEGKLNLLGHCSDCAEEEEE